MDYEERYCDRCVHQRPDDGGCAVMFAHMMLNYDHCNDEGSILHMLIPRSKDKLDNEQCLMFHEDKDSPRVRDKRIAVLENTLRDVRKAIVEHAPDTLWVNLIETAVDAIDGVVPAK